MRKGLAALWLAACVALLVAYLASPASDIHVVFGYGMAVLTFPCGLLVMWAWGGLLWTLHHQLALDLPRSADVVLWLLLVAVGAWQWFGLFPTLLSRLRRAR